MSYYIGVDGGGTKTAFALFDEDKNIVSSVTGRGSNHENLEGAFDEASVVIWEGICELLNQAGITLADVGFTLMGLAGIDHPFQHDIMCEKLREKGLENFEIYNDGFIVVKAGSLSGAAIGYNCGTGTCCNAIDSDCRMLQLGGFSECSGDVGNGTWIAQTAFRLIYDEVYLGLEPTAITKMYYERFNIGSREEFLASIAKLETDEAPDYIMSLISFFFAAAQSGDAPAMRYIDVMAKRGAELICALIKQMNFAGDEVEVVLSGSMHTKLPNTVYLEKLSEHAQSMSGRKINFIKLDKAPVTGCINWIFQEYK